MSLELRKLYESAKTKPKLRHKVLELRPEKVFNDGRTKQAFKDECDVNKILYQAQKTGAISHLNRFGGEYGDFSDIPDLLEAHKRLERAEYIFDSLPSEVKREFNQSPAEFFTFANDPDNAGRLKEIWPSIAEKGDQRPTVRNTPASLAASEAAEAAAVGSVESSDSVDSGASEGA